LLRARRHDDGLIRRPPAWKQFNPLEVACGAALAVRPEQVRPDLLVVEGALGSVVSASSPCPLTIVETFCGTAVRVFDPLRPAIENLVREGMAQGAALSQANRERIMEVVSARLPIVEVWNDLLHYTDPEHFVPWVEHRVRRISGAAERERQKAERRSGEAPFHQAFGIYVKRRLVAYADIATRGDYACSLGVFTEQQFRGRGMAKSAASAATRAILRAGRIPLYSADETNTASLSICRALGYLRFGRDLYCFMASEEERARREQAVQEAERRAADFALHRWIID
jgi:RimJ/RimL family protein N-acetyltransferase